MNAPNVWVYLGNINSQPAFKTFYEKKYCPKISSQPAKNMTFANPNSIVVLEDENLIKTSRIQRHIEDFGPTRITAFIYWNVEMNDAELEEACRFFSALLDGYISPCWYDHTLYSLGYLDPAPITRPITSYIDWEGKEGFTPYEIPIRDNKRKIE